MGSVAVFTTLPPRTTNNTHMVYIEHQKWKNIFEAFGTSMTCKDNTVIIGASDHR